MSSRREIEDHQLLSALESLQTRDPMGTDAGDSAENRESQRLVAELLCTLPAALDPIAASADSKSRLLERVSTAKRVDRSPVHLVTRSAKSNRQRRTLMRLAAALGSICLGLAVLSGWLLESSRDQRSQIARLRLDVEAARGRRSDPTPLPGALAEHVQRVAAWPAVQSG